MQQRLPVLALVGTAGLVVLTLVAIVLWLELSSDVVTEEMRSSRPQVNVRMIGSKKHVAGSATAGEQAKGQDADDADVGSAAKDAEHAEDNAAHKDSEAGQERQVPDTAGKAQTVLHPHPDPQLVEKTDIGPLPIIGKDGRQPWRVYSRPFNALEKRPRVAIVMVGLGVSFNATESAVADLPGEVTLSFEPFSEKLDEWITAARGAGHEVLLNLPMEPQGYPRNDPGPTALMTGYQPDENKRRLEWLMSRMSGYVGVTNFQGNRFAGNKIVLLPVLRNLARRGLMFVDTVDYTLSAIPVSAAELKMPLALKSVLVDEVANRAAIEKKLSVIQKIASQGGAAVIIARPYPVSIRLLKRWISTMGDQGLVLAPVSAVANRQKFE